MKRKARAKVGKRLRFLSGLIGGSHPAVAPSAASPPGGRPGQPAVVQLDQPAPTADAPAKPPPSAAAPAEDVPTVDPDKPALSTYTVDRGLTDESITDWWKRCSGLHTVRKWVLNYRKHPAGWAALLMIQGIPEVTSRLRSKVESYAIYSALFLSFSIPTCFSIPTVIYSCPASPAEALGVAWGCEVRKRLFFYSISAGVALHMLCIVLAMAFVNALNEAARDSDVYRMFARGQGFLATVKCQRAFRSGAAANFFAIAVAGHAYVGWEAPVLWVVLICLCYRVYKPTSARLFQNASIVDYWRRELGGNPDPDDPYDLRIAAECFEARVAASKAISTSAAFDREGQGAEGEGEAEHGARRAQQFARMDANGDGVVDIDEAVAFLDKQKEVQDSLERHEHGLAARHGMASGGGQHNRSPHHGHDHGAEHAHSAVIRGF